MPGKHILNLLNTHGRVIVPELGAFILKGKSIYFNEFLRFNDGVLADYMAEHDKINKEESTKKITDFVAKVHKQLSTSKAVELEGLGMLIVDGNDKIQLKPSDFKPEQATVQNEKDASPREVYFEIEKNDSEIPAKPVAKSSKKTKPSSSKGQPNTEIPKQQDKEDIPIEIEIEKSAKPVVIEEKTVLPTSVPEEIKTPAEVKEESKPQTVLQTVSTEVVSPPSPIKTADVSLSQPSQPRSHTPTQASKQSPPLKQVTTTGSRNGNKIWLIVLIVIVLGVVGYFVFQHRFFKESNVNQNIIIGGKNMNDNTAVADSMKTVAESSNPPVPIHASEEVATTKEQKKTDISEDNNSKPLRKVTSGKRYYLIAGCFSVEANADKMVHKLITNGYPAEKFVRSNNNLYYVSFSSHASSAEATQELDRLKAAGESNVWILGY